MILESVFDICETFADNITVIFTLCEVVPPGSPSVPPNRALREPRSAPRYTGACSKHFINLLQTCPHPVPPNPNPSDGYKDLSDRVPPPDLFLETILVPPPPPPCVMPIGELV